MVNGCLSDFVDLAKSGAVQGSEIGKTMFVTFTNDLIAPGALERCGVTCKRFADDRKLGNYY